jgi:hypothetical protein
MSTPEQWKKRNLSVILNIADGKLGDTSGRDLELKNLRMSARVQAYSGWAQGQLQMQIYGLPIDTMNEMTRIGPIMNQRRNNKITVRAGDEGRSQAIVYDGVIFSAYADFQSAPEVVFNILALSAAFFAAKDANPISKKGAFQAESVAAQIAGSIGVGFENNGVSVTLQNKSYTNSPLTQLRELSWDAGFEYTIDNNLLAIWPKDNGYRSGSPITISTETGMVGYPAFSNEGVEIITLFNPDISVGGRVDIRSDLKVACGLWTVRRVIHSLAAETPNGNWFTYTLCFRSGL